jgi:hypothetical protein
MSGWNQMYDIMLTTNLTDPNFSDFGICFITTVIVVRVVLSRETSNNKLTGISASGNENQGAVNNFH